MADPRKRFEESERGFWAAWTVLGAATAALLLGFRDLPLIDLPQHAAQLSIWVHHADPAYGFAERYEINWFTPYLIAFLLARPFVGWLGVMGAEHVVLTLGVLATPLALRVLLRAAGRDGWLALLGFPLAMGVGFAMGFVNFVLSTPVVFLLIAHALVFVERPSRGRAAGLVALSCALFFCHGLAYAFGLGVCGAVLLVGRPTWRARLSSWALLLPSVALALAWRPQLEGVARMDPAPEEWRLGLHRVLGLPSALVGSSGVAATLAGATFLLLVLLDGARPGRRKERWVPLALALASYLLVPGKMRGVGVLWPRFSVYVLPLLAVALEPAARGPVRRVARLLLVPAVLGWLGFSAVRLRAFDLEARGFHDVVARVPLGQRVRSLMLDVHGTHFPFAFYNYGAYCQALRGGSIRFSFGVYPMAFARYPPAERLLLDHRPRPEEFSYAEEADLYDYYLVRSQRDPAQRLFGGSDVVEVARSGPWRLYAPVQPEAAARPAPER